MFTRGRKALHPGENGLILGVNVVNQ